MWTGMNKDDFGFFLLLYRTFTGSGSFLRGRDGFSKHWGKEGLLDSNSFFEPKVAAISHKRRRPLALLILGTSEIQ
jgi:hypothetical protein